MTFATTNLVLIVSSVIILLIIIYFKRKFNYWKNRGVKTLNPKIPFGNIGELVSKKVNFLNIYEKLYNTFKSQGSKYVGYYFFAKPVLVILDPQLIKIVLVQHFSHFTDHYFYIDEERDPFSVNLLALRGEKWKTLRNKLTPAFTSGKMRMMFQNLVEVSRRLQLVLDKCAENSETVNIGDLAGKYSTDVIGNCIFGFDCNSLQGKNDELRKILKDVTGETAVTQIKFALGFFWHGIFRFFNIRLLSPTIENYIRNLIGTIIKQRETENCTRNDLMQLFIELRNNKAIDDEHSIRVSDGNKAQVEAVKSLSITEIAAHCLFFYVAGYESSSATISFLLYELLRNKEIYNKLKEEIAAVSEKHDNEITYNSIQDMTYLDQCVHEILRKYPATPFLFRKCTKEMQLADSFVIEKDTQIHIPLKELHWDPEYFPQPEKFDPERFSAENKPNIPQYTYMPFGEGPRICLGSKMGLLQVKVAIVSMMKNFNFSLNYKTENPLRLHPIKFVPTVLGGIWVNVEKVRT